MNKVLTSFSLLILTIGFTANVFGQNKPEMADLMRSNGKIYIVVAVCLTILTGLFLYVMRIDYKIRQIEKNKEV